jgi:hypothetical protein
VLDEVRDAELRFALEDGAGVDDEPELGALLRLAIAPDQLVQAVGENTAQHRRIRGQWRVGLRAGRHRCGDETREEQKRGGDTREMRHDGRDSG